MKAKNKQNKERTKERNMDGKKESGKYKQKQ